MIGPVWFSVWELIFSILTFVGREIQANQHVKIHTNLVSLSYYCYGIHFCDKSFTNNSLFCGS